MRFVSLIFRQRALSRGLWLLALIAGLIVSILMSRGTAPVSAATILGQHVVQNGETLYCIGRAYGVLPNAIAQASGISGFSLLSPGQTLSIPDTPWPNMPSGPTCRAQFTSPFGGGGVASTRTATRPVATPIASGGTLGQHIVQRGETVYCIGRAYGVLPSAIAQANNLSATALLTPGQVLTIPSVRWANIPPGPACRPQFGNPLSTATPSPTSSGSSGGGDNPTATLDPFPTKTLIPSKTIPPTKTP